MKLHRWILVGEDNPHDAELTVRALTEIQPRLEVVVANDGEEVLDCLYRRGGFKTRASAEPVLVLLDLKMPKVNGFQVLGEIRSDARLRVVPVVVFSSSCEESDVARAYEMGANAFVVKPLGFQDYTTALMAIGRFWAELNEPPHFLQEFRPSDHFTASTPRQAA